MKKRNIYKFSVIYFLIDLISKIIITSTLKLNDIITVIPNFFHIHYVRNFGAAFNVLINRKNAIIIISLLSLYFINKYILEKDKYEKLEIIILSMLIGGIIGNLFDRIFYGYVIDFLSFELFSYNFPIFNLADVFIVLGAFILIVLNLGSDNNEKDKS